MNMWVADNLSPYDMLFLYILYVAKDDTTHQKDISVTSQIALI